MFPPAAPTVAPAATARKSSRPRCKRDDDLAAIATTDHIRRGVGRTDPDATPTRGTIFVGGGGETPSAEVTVEPHV